MTYLTGIDGPSWAPHGPRAEGHCMAEDEDGLQTCDLPPTWRLTVLDVQSEVHARRRLSESLRQCRISVADDEPSWLVCTPHLRDAIVLTDETYGSAIAVEVHHG